MLGAVANLPVQNILGLSRAPIIIIGFFFPFSTIWPRSSLSQSIKCFCCCVCFACGKEKGWEEGSTSPPHPRTSAASQTHDVNRHAEGWAPSSDTWQPLSQGMPPPASGENSHVEKVIIQSCLTTSEIQTPIMSKNLTPQTM